jgi:hypothetical protein
MRRKNMMPWMMLMSFAVGLLVWAGCKKSDSSTEPTEGQNSVVTVTGTAVGGNLHPLQHFPVVIAGHVATVTDENGAFSISGVKTPYDITVVDPATKGALVYVGLTRPDPTLVWQTQATGIDRSGGITGVVSGGAFAPVQGPNDQTKILLYLASNCTFQTSVEGAESDSFSVWATWKDTPTCTGTMIALQFAADPVTGFPAANGFKGFGTLPNTTVTDKSVLGGQALPLQAMAPSQTGQFSAAIAPPPGFSVTAKDLSLRPHVNGLIPILSDSSASTTVTYNAPAISGSSLTFHARATNGQGATTELTKGGLVTGPAAQSIVLPGPPELSLPVADANSVDTTTEFSWRPLEGGVHVVFFTPANAGSPSYQIVTMNRSCRLPNLKAYGMVLPSAEQYSWSILAIAPVSSVDAAADPSLLNPICQQGEITSATVLASTPARPFRTAP